jgi:polyphosphate kinase
VEINVANQLDRELSWLDFNFRVLGLAEDPNIPLLERVKYLAIVFNNLDEFFMVRVANLKVKVALDNSPMISGLTPEELIKEIRVKVKNLYERVDFLVKEDLFPLLTLEGIKEISWNSLSQNEQDGLSKYFVDNVLPVLTPLVVDPSHPFPHISGLSLNLGIQVITNGESKPKFIRLKVPTNLPRLIRVVNDEDNFILLEDLISENLQLLLPGAQVLDFHVFRITRNQDFEIYDEDIEDIAESMENELAKRKFGQPVRLEVESGIDPETLEKLIEELEISRNEVYITTPPLDLRVFFEIYSSDRPDLKYTNFKSKKPKVFKEIESTDYDGFFSAIKQQEILLHHPYVSFTNSVVRMIEAAARDPKVLAIKQTLYRTSGDSPIVKALIAAAEAGKQVLAVIEIRARFDEEANMNWADLLEKAGAHVVYGVVGLKTHAKACLIVRKEDEGIQFYSHVGTGNYNPKTARIYEDLGLISSDFILGRDLMTLFNQLSGLAPESDYVRLVVAPKELRTFFIDRIRNEVANHLNGLESYIRFKLNSLLDKEIIDELYIAAKAGVKIEILSRGICTFKLSEVADIQNVKVISVLGRYLEHSRIYNFCDGGKNVYYIGSADLMERNLNRRVEILTEISEQKHKDRMKLLLDKPFSGEYQHWRMNKNNSWDHIKRDENGEILQDLHQHYIERFAK